MRNFSACVVDLTIVRVTKSRIRWAGHVVKIEEGRSVLKILIGKTYWKETSRKAKA